MAKNEEVSSPCISVCAMDDVTGLCLGCYRTDAEIEQWWELKPAEQQEIVDKAAARQIDQAKFD